MAVGLGKNEDEGEKQEETTNLEAPVKKGAASKDAEDANPGDESKVLEAVMVVRGPKNPNKAPEDSEECEGEEDLGGAGEEGLKGVGGAGEEGGGGGEEQAEEQEPERQPGCGAEEGGGQAPKSQQEAGDEGQEQEK